jgi:signal transduction histidine kinase
MERNKEKIVDSDVIKNFYSVSHQILLFSNKKISIEVFLREVFKILHNVLECGFIDLWFKNKHHQFYSSYNHDMKPKMKFENINHKLDFKRKYLDNRELSILCEKIMKGEIKTNLKNSTSNGSYFNNNIQYRKGKTVINSIAIITINRNFKREGLLIISCTKKDHFNIEKVELFENIAQSLEIALNHLHIQSSLNERVKELTCLYGIARTGEKVGLSLENILQKIVELLPSAWQYPKIATARIVLDSKYYTTPNFSVSSKKQSSNIILNGVKRGFVEVVYPDNSITFDENPFLKEEQDLIDVVAGEIAAIVERRFIKNEKDKLQNQLLHADRLATIGQLSAGVAHELNEPLSNILGFAQLLQKNTKLEKQGKEDINSIITASLHSREIIKKLMLFARQMPPQKTKVNINQIVENGLYFLMSRCSTNGIEVKQSLAKDIKEIVADSSQLNQVLVNLVVNSIQAMPNGGKLSIKTESSNNHISLIIEDTGIGMSDEVLEQIFIPFFTTKDITEGTGLGLSVVHGIVSSHDGIIKVESKVDVGSKFEIILPLYSE